MRAFTKKLMCGATVDVEFAANGNNRGENLFKLFVRDPGSLTNDGKTVLVYRKSIPALVRMLQRIYRSK